MKAAEAVLEGHESELGLDAAQVDLDDVHVRGVENEEDLKSRQTDFISQLLQHTHPHCA